MHATLRRSQTRFDSWRGYLAARRLITSPAPRECVGRTAVFEAARPGPIPGRGIGRDCNTSSECAGFARDSAKVEDQVQFLARTSLSLTLEPDGQATGCNPVQVGSTPTGVFEDRASWIGRRASGQRRSSPSLTIGFLLPLREVAKGQYR